MYIWITHGDQKEKFIIEFFGKRISDSAFAEVLKRKFQLSEHDIMSAYFEQVDVEGINDRVYSFSLNYLSLGAIYELKIGEPRQPNKSDILMGTVIKASYPYTGNSEEELSFNRDEELLFLESYDDNWFIAQHAISGKVGLAPYNYCAGFEEEFDYDNNYFVEYAKSDIHRMMLADRVRTLAYKTAIESIENIGNKLVLDIGCGTGILSLFAAQYGAKHVIAVDASMIINDAIEIARENKLDKNITFIKGRVEEVHNQILDVLNKYDAEQIDVLISEWMGVGLFNECMFQSVVQVRDLFLSADGLMLPYQGFLHLAPINDEEYFNKYINFWDDVYGFSYAKSMRQKSINEIITIPNIDEIISADQLLSEPTTIGQYDFKTIQLNQLEKIESDFSFIIEKTELLHGFALWFSVKFPNCNVDIDTSPEKESTHWKQIKLLAEKPIDVKKGDVISGRFSQQINHITKRNYIYNIVCSLNGKEYILDLCHKW